MSDDRSWLRQIGIPWFLGQYPLMVIHPAGPLRLVGALEFEAEHAGKVVRDSFELEIVVPRSFPDDLITGDPRHLPRVFEVAGRIPPDFHRFPTDQHLCLGSPFKVFATLTAMPTLRGLNRLLLSYLYSFCISGGKKELLPWKDLDHGIAGELQDYCLMFDAKTAEEVAEYLVRLTMGRTSAGATPCSCKSGNRFSACHAKRVEQYRNVWSNSKLKLEACRFLQLAKEQEQSKAAADVVGAASTKELRADQNVSPPAAPGPC